MDQTILAGPVAGHRFARRAFTLVELLAVTVIIVLLIGVAVPAFSSMLKSSAASIADSNLRVGLAASRDIAIRSLDGRHSAAVFVFEPGGKASIIACADVGSYTDASGVERSVFVPDPTIEPFVLPTPFLVRGLAPTGSWSPGADDDDKDAVVWYGDNRYRSNELSWVLPETGFYDRFEGDEGFRRQTFMVRFKAGTGEVAVGRRDEALVYLPSPEIEFRRTGPWNQIEYRPDRRSDHQRLVRAALNDPGLNAADLEQLLGDEASDTVLARPVGQIALYDVRELARMLRKNGTSSARVDKQTGSLYAGVVGQSPTLVADFVLAAQVNAAIPQVAQLFTIDRYSGSTLRLEGSGP